MGRWHGGCNYSRHGPVRWSRERREFCRSRWRAQKDLCSTVEEWRDDTQSSDGGASGRGVCGCGTFYCNALAADVAAVGLTVAAIALDGVDGYLARTRGMATPLGAQLDILGDRVVENLFFTFFAVAGLVSLWLPILFFVRGTLIDFLRGVAGRAGRSGFGTASMQETWWGRALVESRGSRAAYAILKCVCFCYLGLLLPVGRWQADWLDAGVRHSLLLGGQMLAGAVAVFCVVRAVPVVWEGRRYLGAIAAERKLP